MFQLLDPNELTFPFHGSSRFKDVESADEVTAEPESIRSAYLRGAREPARDDTTATCAARASTIVQLDTSKPLDFALLGYLVGAGAAEVAGADMSFLYPAFLVGALAVAIPIVLHLLRRDVAPEVPFTAVRLLHKSPVERAERRRLRDFLLLAARVAALLLLAAAFARPYLQGRDARPLAPRGDRSLVQHGRRRACSQRALDRAREAVAAAPRGERVAVIAFDDRADVLAPPGGAADARAALDGLAAGIRRDALRAGLSAGSRTRRRRCRTAGRSSPICSAPGGTASRRRISRPAGRSRSSTRRAAGAERRRISR